VHSHELACATPRSLTSRERAGTVLAGQIGALLRFGSYPAMAMACAGRAACCGSTTGGGGGTGASSVTTKTQSGNIVTVEYDVVSTEDQRPSSPAEVRITGRDAR